MKLAPLQLAGCFLTEVRIICLPGAKEADLLKVDFQVDVNPSPDKDNERRWYVVLRLKIIPKDGQNACYSGEVEMFGSFDIAPEWPREQIEKLVYINGSGLLFAAIRELVCSITARGFYPMLTIPSWSFADMYRESKSQAEPSTAVIPEASPTLPPPPPPQ